MQVHQLPRRAVRVQHARLRVRFVRHRPVPVGDAAKRLPRLRRRFLRSFQRHLHLRHLPFRQLQQRRRVGVHRVRRRLRGGLGGLVHLLALQRGVLLDRRRLGVHRLRGGVLQQRLARHSLRLLPHR